MEMTMETICRRTNLMKKETSRPLGFDHRITNKRGCCSIMAMQIVIRRAWSLTFRTLWRRCSGSWRANVWRPPERVLGTNSPCFVLPLREKTLSALTWRAGIIESGLWEGWRRTLRTSPYKQDSLQKRGTTIKYSLSWSRSNFNFPLSGCCWCSETSKWLALACRSSGGYC